MDSPILAGPNLWHRTYTSNGIPFHIWVCRTTPDEQRFVQEHQDFTDAQIAHFGSFPAPHYHFLYVLPERECATAWSTKTRQSSRKGRRQNAARKKATWS